MSDDPHKNDREIVERIKKLVADTADLKNLIHEKVVAAADAKLKANNYAKNRLRVEVHSLIEYLPYSTLPKIDDWSFDDKGDVRVGWAESWYGHNRIGTYSLDLGVIMVGQLMFDYMFRKQQEEVEAAVQARIDQQRADDERALENLKRKLGQ